MKTGRKKPRGAGWSQIDCMRGCGGKVWVNASKIVVADCKDHQPRKK